MVGCASALTYQGSTEPPLRSASGPHAWGAAKVHPTAMFACLMAAVRQRLMRSILEAQVARHRAFLEEMEMDLEEPPGPLEPPEAQGTNGS